MRLQTSSSVPPSHIVTGKAGNIVVGYLPVHRDPVPYVVKQRAALDRRLPSCSLRLVISETATNSHARNERAVAVPEDTETTTQLEDPDIPWKPTHKVGP